MVNCLGCGGLKEFEKDQYCQTCEGKHEASIYSGVVRLEVMTMANKLDLDLRSERVMRFAEVSKQRWVKIAMNMIDTKTYNTYYQAFMQKFRQLTTDIRPSEKTSTVASPVHYE
jgi:hypothetical protein